MAKQWFAIVTLGSARQWQQGGFETKAAALKAAEVYASKHKKQGVTGFRAERE